MKKVISLLLALTFVLAFATTSYCAELTLTDTDSIKLIGKVSDVENNEVSLSFYLVGNEGDTIVMPFDGTIGWAIGIGFDNTVLTLKELPTLGYDIKFGSNATKLGEVTNSFYLEMDVTGTGSLTLTPDEAIATFKFAIAENATSVEDFTLNAFEIGDTDFNTVGLDYDTPYSIEKIQFKKVVSANTSTTIEADDATYTDVVNFDSSLTNVTAIDPTLKFDLYEDGTKHKSYSVALGNGVTLEGGTLSFKIAVIGAPADKALTLVNPTIAE